MELWGSGNDLKVKLDLNRTLGLMDALITSPEIPDDFFNHPTDSFTQAFLQLCQDYKERKRKRKREIWTPATVPVYGNVLKRLGALIAGQSEFFQNHSWPRVLLLAQKRDV